MPTPVNPNIPQNTSAQPSGNDGTNTPTPQQQYQQALQAYQQDLQGLGERTNGANRNIQTTQREIENLSGGLTGFFSRVSGTRAGLESTLQTETRYRDQLQSQLSQRQQVLQRAEQAARQGDHGTARAILQGNEEEHRRQLIQTGRQATQGLQSSNQQLAQADTFLRNTEAGLRAGQRVCVVAAAVGATVMTGGAGAPLLVTALTATAAGTGISAATYLTEAGGHVAQGNMSASNAFGRAGRQIGSDALLSAQIGLAGGAGYAVNGIRALSSVSVVGRGMIAGGTGGLTSSVFQTTTGMALGTDDRTWGQRIIDTGVQTAVGVATGGIGARGQTVLNGMTQQGTNTFLRTAGVRAVSDVIAPTVVGTGATALTNYLTGRDIPTLGQAVEQAGTAILGSAIGAHAARNPNPNQSWQQNMRQQLTETPTFNSIGNSLSRLFSRQVPPAPASPLLTQTNGNQLTQNTQTNSATETMVPPRVILHEELPANVTNNNAYRYANRNGRNVQVIVDPNLPANHPARADVVINQNGRRTTILRVRTAAELNNTNRIAHELRHANSRQGITDPVVHNSQGNVTRRMSENEYFARRSLEEFHVRAGRGPNEAPHGPNVAHTRRMQELIRNGDFEGAVRYARSNGLENYMRGFGQDYQANVNRNPSSQPLVQRGNDSGRSLREIVNDIQSNSNLADQLLQPGNERLLNLISELAVPNGSVPAGRHFANAARNAGFANSQEARTALNSFLNSNGVAGRVLRNELFRITPQSEPTTHLNIPETAGSSQNGRVRQMRSNTRDIEITRNNDTGETSISINSGVSDARIHNNLLQRIVDNLRAGRGIHELSGREVKIEKTVGDRSLVCIHGRTNSRVYGVYNSDTGTLTWLGIAPDHNAWTNIITNFR